MEKVSLSNKVFTENPLLDEIVYNIRQLAVGAILKDEDKANNYETTDSIKNGDILIMANEGQTKYEYFYYDFDTIRKALPGISVELALQYARDNSLVPQDYRKSLLSVATKDFLDNYIEYNDYYRMLNGLPDYDETGVFQGLWIDVNHIDLSIPTPIEFISKFYKEEYKRDSKGDIQYDEDGNKIITSDYHLIHLLPISYQNMIYANGTCENILNDSDQIEIWELTKNELEYLNHIGDRKVDFYTARKSQKFSLLYCPDCQSPEVQRRFKDLIEANRIYLLYTVYSDAYKFRSEYYDNFMMIFIVLQTAIDMIVELPEYIIRRDIFDARTCKYIFESNGVKYFKDIPLKYQISLVKNLNKLLKFKSTDKCIVDIVSIFGISNIEIFKYYILKDRNIDDPKELDYYANEKEVTDSLGNILIQPDNDSNYDLKFIKVPLLENYDDYIRKESNIKDYDSLTSEDPYWVGEKTTEAIKSDIKNLDFTILRSKYYSIEAIIDLSKRNFTVTYFMNLLMYNKIDKSKLKINLPNIATAKAFELEDIILTVFSLSYLYYGVEDTILDTRSKIAQILGFNMEADLGKIASWLEENHRGLTLKDCHVDTFYVPEQGKILSFNELHDMYFTNKDIYDHILQIMRDPPSKEIYDAYRYLYKSLMIMNRNMECFLIGENEVVDHYKQLGFKTKFINIPKDHEYTNPDDYQRDYKWLLESLDSETLLFEMANDFEESHNFDLYIKSDDITLTHVGTARMAYTYREYLRYKDSTLYSFLENISRIQNEETRQESCINAIQAIISYLQDYIDNDIDLNEVFSGTPSISLDFIKRYITEVIDFFSSFKIFTHGSSIIYLIDYKYENYIQLIDHILLKYLLDKSELVRIEDQFKGKVKNIAGKLIDSGNGLQMNLTTKEYASLLDKVWFSIDTWISKNCSEIYNSENYQEKSDRIKEIIYRLTTFNISDDIFSEHYIQEIEQYAVDALLNILVDIMKSETIIIKDEISVIETQDFKDYYNEWISDIITLFMITKTFEDNVRYQDEIIKFSTLTLDHIFPILDGLSKININKILDSDRIKISEDYYSIITKEFPAHTFDN